MNENGIKIHELPDLKNPLLIAGFDGWGNALQISSGMAAYLIRTFKAQRFAELDPDVFFRYDEKRPVVHIEDGLFKEDGVLDIERIKLALYLGSDNYITASSEEVRHLDRIEYGRSN